jgi:hypothetical protein
MSRVIKMFELVPTSKWQFKLDCIVDNEGSTGFIPTRVRNPLPDLRRPHRGSEKGECSENFEQGDFWYEEGAYPLISTTQPGSKATFLRAWSFRPSTPTIPIPPSGSKARRPARATGSSTRKASSR